MWMLIILFVAILATSLLFGFMVFYDYSSVAVVTGAITAIASSFVTMILPPFLLHPVPPWAVPMVSFPLIRTHGAPVRRFLRRKKH